MNIKDSVSEHSADIRATARNTAQLDSDQWHDKRDRVCGGVAALEQHLFKQNVQLLRWELNRLED